MNRYQELTIELLEGRITRKGEQELSDYLQEADGRAEQLHQWERAWNQEEHTNSLTEAMWQQFLSRVDKPRVLDSGYRRRAFRWVAASLLLLCSVSLTVLLWHRPTQATTSIDSPVAVTHTTVDCANSAMTTIVLPDSSRVTINKGSTLTYASDFGKQERRVVLEGEAYFEVAKDATCPFIVKADGCEIWVTGTCFNVSAYEQDAQTTITLLEGSIKVTHPLFNADLVPGEKLIYTRANKELVKRLCDADASIAWIEGKMDYDQVRLEELLARLSRLYNESIVLEDTLLRNKDVHYYMDERYPLGEVLNALGEVYNLDVTKTDGVWKVKVKG